MLLALRRSEAQHKSQKMERMGEGKGGTAPKGKREQRCAINTFENSDWMRRACRSINTGVGAGQPGKKRKTVAEV